MSKEKKRVYRKFKENPGNPEGYKNLKVVEPQEDDKGLYKVCDYCGNKYYLDKFAERMPNKGLAPYLFKRSRYCSRKCKKLFKTRKFKFCEHCGEKYHKYEYLNKEKWEKQKYCSKSCNTEVNNIRAFAKRMGLPYEVLKKELVRILKKYQENDDR